LNPSDPDARANFQMAAQRTGASIPEPWLVPELLRKASSTSWSTFALTAWWGMLGLLALRLLWRACPVKSPAILTTGILAIAVGLTGRLSSHDLTRTEEAVVLQAAELKSAPANDSATLVKLPEGSIVTVAEDGGTWLRLRSGKDSGWAPANRISRVRVAP
jgi:hypothetical protein